ncbi:MAG: DUF2797 domain-containing protein [Bacteroidetes bacterium]|nr:DUF2797 domain-containing protein [Bacteroidota bacterium]
MNLAFNLMKMPTAIEQGVIQYFIGTDRQSVNQWIGKRITIQFEGRINCIDCGKLTKKSFGQGFCYTCFMSSTNNAPCIIHPELCEAHLGKGRDPEWEMKNHNQPHIVYLANSGGLKVGVTRNDQIPTRWIDQGADFAICFARTPYRRLAGEIEVFLKQHLSDKTNWRKMLANIPDENVDLIESKEEMAELLPFHVQEFYLEDNSIMDLHYPLLVNPAKINSFGLDKKPQFTGILSGIKGSIGYLNQAMSSISGPIKAILWI